MKTIVVLLALTLVVAVPVTAQVVNAVNIEGYDTEAAARAVFSTKTGVGKALLPLRTVNPNGGSDRVTYLVIYQVPAWQYELGVGQSVLTAGLPAHSGTCGLMCTWSLGPLTAALYSTEADALAAASMTAEAERNTLRLSQRATTEGAEWEYVAQPYSPRAWQP